jgi:hypothetical protein
MDGDFVLDLEDVNDSVEHAEVMSMSFPKFNQALVIDTRSNRSDGPLVCIMPMVGSPQERIRSIRKVRGGFPRIESLTVIPWPRYVDSLVSLGVWDRIVARLTASGHNAPNDVCDALLKDLRRLEKEEIAAVLSGENYHTIWSANA